MSSNILSSIGFANSKQTVTPDSGNPLVDSIENKESVVESANIAHESKKKSQDVVAEKANIVTEKDIREAMEVVSSFVNQPPRNVNFMEDTDSGKTVIKVFDNSSKELIKQFPSEELISIAQKIRALHQQVGEQAGIFLDTSV